MFFFFNVLLISIASVCCLSYGVYYIFSLRYCSILLVNLLFFFLLCCFYSSIFTASCLFLLTFHYGSPSLSHNNSIYFSTLTFLFLHFPFLVSSTNASSSDSDYSWPQTDEAIITQTLRPSLLQWAAYLAFMGGPYPRPFLSFFTWHPPWCS